MVVSEKIGSNTVLTTSTQDAYVDYDLGSFQNVHISIKDEYSIALSFQYCDESDRDDLCIWLFENSDTTLYVYDYRSNILYGNNTEPLLFDKFISLYYSWIGDDGKFTPEDSGNYTYVYTEFPLSHK